MFKDGFFRLWEIVAGLVWAEIAKHFSGEAEKKTVWAALYSGGLDGED